MATSHKSKGVVVEYNPYSQMIRFFYDGKESTKSRELAEEKDFFLQARMDEVIQLLLKVYAVQKNELNITFNGITEDFYEFQAACAEYIVKKNDSRKITVTLGERMPSPIDQKKKIDEVFNTLKKELIDGLNGPEKTKCEGYIQKYKDASSSEIKIIIFGIFNSGKSALINAVLGYKILPTENTDKTKIWTEIRSGKPRLKIMVNNNSGASDILSYNVEKSEGDYKLRRNQTENIRQDNNDFKAVTKLLEEVGKGQDFSDVIYRALDVLTDENKNKRIIQSVKVWVPFDRTTVNKNIVFIDLPGKGSMDKQSGKDFINNIRNSSISIPLIVLGSDAVAGKNDISSLLEEYGADIDNSRKVYIINKADTLQKLEEINTIKEDFQLNFKSQYMMTSALMGLEAKLQKNGDEDNKKLYKDNSKYFSENKDEMKKAYNEEEIRNYISLYQLYKHNNIWDPSIDEQCEQYKRKHNNTEDKIYVNSGIFAVEKMLNKFAEIYAACYKCQKAEEYVLELADKVKTFLVENKEKIQSNIDSNEKDKERALNELMKKLGDFISPNVKKQRNIKLQIDVRAKNLSDSNGSEITQLSETLKSYKRKNVNSVNSKIENIEMKLNRLLDSAIKQMKEQAYDFYEACLENEIWSYVDKSEEFSEQVKAVCRNACIMKKDIKIPRVKKGNIFDTIKRFLGGSDEVEQIARSLSVWFEDVCKANGNRIVEVIENGLKKKINGLITNKKSLEDKGHIMKKYNNEIKKLEVEKQKLNKEQERLQNIIKEVYGGQI